MIIIENDIVYQVPESITSEAEKNCDFDAAFQVITEATMKAETELYKTCVTETEMDFNISILIDDMNSDLGKATFSVAELLWNTIKENNDISKFITSKFDKANLENIVHGEPYGAFDMDNKKSIKCSNCHKMISSYMAWIDIVKKFDKEKVITPLEYEYFLSGDPTNPVASIDEPVIAVNGKKDIIETTVRKLVEEYAKKTNQLYYSPKTTHAGVNSLN